MPRFYKPDLSQDINSPFIRDGEDKLVRRMYWMDMNDRTLVKVMVDGIGAKLTNDEKRRHLTDLRRGHLIDQVCVQEILPPRRMIFLKIDCVFDLANNPGTSVEEIERLYAHNLPLPKEIAENLQSFGRG